MACPPEMVRHARASPCYRDHAQYAANEWKPSAGPSRNRSASSGEISPPPHAQARGTPEQPTALTLDRARHLEDRSRLGQQTSCFLFAQFAGPCYRAEDNLSRACLAGQQDCLHDLENMQRQIS